jgi:hypothetical protein
MSSRLRNGLVAFLAVVLGSSALSSRDFIIFLDYGGPNVDRPARQEMMFVSAVPALHGQEVVAPGDQALKRALEALGIWVD